MINELTEAIINPWYDSTTTVGSRENVPPSFSAGVLSWFGSSSDQLQTTNTNLTRYDDNISRVSGYIGRVYVNSYAATSLHFKGLCRRAEPFAIDLYKPQRSKLCV